MMRLFHPNTLYLKQLLLKTIRFIPLNNGQDRLHVCLIHCLQTCYIDLHAWGPIEVVLGDQHGCDDSQLVIWLFMMRFFHPNTLYLKQLLLKTIRFIPLNNSQDWPLDAC